MLLVIVTFVHDDIFLLVYIWVLGRCYYINKLMQLWIVFFMALIIQQNFYQFNIFFCLCLQSSFMPLFSLVVIVKVHLHYRLHLLSTIFLHIVLCRSVFVCCCILVHFVLLQSFRLCHHLHLLQCLHYHVQCVFIVMASFTPL